MPVERLPVSESGYPVECVLFELARQVLWLWRSLHIASQADEVIREEKVPYLENR